MCGSSIGVAATQPPSTTTTATNLPPPQGPHPGGRLGEGQGLGRQGKDRAVTGHDKGPPVGAEGRLEHGPGEHRSTSRGHSAWSPETPATRRAPRWYRRWPAPSSQRRRAPTAGTLMRFVWLRWVLAIGNISPPPGRPLRQRSTGPLNNHKKKEKSPGVGTVLSGLGARRGLTVLNLSQLA